MSLLRLIPRDARGSIAAAGITAGVIATGAAFYVIAAGDAAAEREQMAAHAVSGATESATTFARVLNTAALLNVTLVALVSIISGLKAIEALVILGFIIAAWIFSFCTPYTTPPCYAGPPKYVLNVARGYMSSLIDTVEPYIKTVTSTARECLKQMDLGFLVVIHKLAQMAMSGQAGQMAQDAAVGYAYQFIPDMPYGDNMCSYVCDVGGDSVLEEWLPGGWPVRMFTTAAIAVYSGDFASALCGGGGSDDSSGVELCGETGFSANEAGCGNFAEPFRQRVHFDLDDFNGLSFGSGAESSALEFTNLVDFTGVVTDKDDRFDLLHEGSRALISEATTYFGDPTEHPAGYLYNMAFTNTRSVPGFDCRPLLVRTLIGKLPDQYRRVAQRYCRQGGQGI